MKSACWYYRSKGMIILRGVANIDYWDAELKKVTDADDALQKDITQFTGEEMRKNLERILGEIKSMKAVPIGIEHFEQMFSSQKKENAANCLGDLFLIDPQQTMKNLKKKKGGLLSSASDWVLETREYAALTDWHGNSGQLLWIKGPPGTGKTMLLISIIEALQDQFSEISPKVAYFFFQGTGDTSKNAVTAALRSLVWMVLVQQPKLAKHFESHMKPKGDTLYKGEQALQSLLELFTAMLEDPRLLPTYIIVDALDECGEGLKDIRDFIQHSLSKPNKVRWLVSSRPIVDLDKSIPQLQLVEIDAGRLDGPVKIFIEHKLSALKDLPGYNKYILAELSVEMQKRAENTFLWVALVFIQLMEEVENLQIPFGIDALEIVKQSPRGLDELYEQMMRKIERGRNQDQQRSKDILSAMVLVQRPLDLFELDVLAGLHADKDVATIETMVKRCGSYLMVAEQKVSFIHQSAKDYLQGCYKTRIQPDGMGRGHEALVSRSIKAMSQGLSQNPYKLSYDTEASSLVVPEPDPLAPYRYSCVFWMDHLGCQIREAIPFRKGPEDYNEVLAFLENHSLIWLESISLLGEIAHGLELIQNLLALIPKQPPIDNRLIPDRVSQIQSGLIEVLTEFERFVSRNASVIATVPLQIYGSALLFSPQTSKIRNSQWSKRPDFVKDISGIKETWSPYRFIFDEFGIALISGIWRVVFSPDGKLLATSSGDGTTRLHETATGMCTRVLFSHKRTGSMSFSPNGELLLTAHADDSLRLWETATGECKRVLHHEDHPHIAKFSPSGRLFSSSSLSTIKIWDTATADVRRVLTIPEPNDCSVFPDLTFSHDDRLLAALIDGFRIRVWDISSGDLVDMVGDEGDPEIIWFWPDGKILARSLERTELWELKNDGIKMLVSHEQGYDHSFANQSLSQFISAHSSSNGHEFQQSLVEAPEAVLEHLYGSAFCPHGKFLATVPSWKETWLNEVMLWDVSEGRLVKSLRGHGSSISSVAFSPDGQTLVSSSTDGQVILWDILVDAPENFLEDQRKQSGCVKLIVFSHNGQVVATATKDNTPRGETSSFIRLWDTESGCLIRTSEESWHELPDVLAIAFDPTGAMLISVHPTEIMFWDCTTGEVRHLLKVFSFPIPMKALFSPGGKHLVRTHWLGASDLEVQHFNITTRASDWSNAMPYGSHVHAWSFSPDGKLLAVFSGSKVEVWDAKTGALQRAVDLSFRAMRLPFSEAEAVAVAVSSGGGTIACKIQKRDKTIQIWNVQNDRLIQEFEVEYPVDTLSFSADGQYINTGLGRVCLNSTHKDCNHIPSGSVSVILPGIPGASRELENWIVKDWQKVIQLPPDRSATAAAFSHGCLALGHKSGDVTFVKLKEDLGSATLQ